MLTKKSYSIRGISTIVVLCLIFGIFSGVLFKIQVIDGKKALEELAKTHISLEQG